MSLTRNSTVGDHLKITTKPESRPLKASPAYSVNTEISRDSGFSTDNGIFEKFPFIPPTAKYPPLPITKSTSMSSGYQSNEITPTNHYEVTSCHVNRVENFIYDFSMSYSNYEYFVNLLDCIFLLFNIFIFSVQVTKLATTQNCNSKMYSSMTLIGQATHPKIH
jgi:hypothetical protein